MHHTTPFAIARLRARMTPIAVAAPAALLGLSALGTLAYSPEVAAQAVEQARRFDIAPGPLAEALSRFALLAGVSIALDAGQLQGLQTAGLQGSFGTDEGFERLLRGSGWQLGRTPVGYVLVKAPANMPQAQAAGEGVHTLREVRVTAEAEPVAISEGTGDYAARLAQTATRLNLSVRETPQAVSVITRQRMEDQGLTQLTDVVAQTPGLVISQGGNQGSDSSPIYSRGFGVDTYMIDGVRHIDSNYTDIVQSYDTALFDRVEIVRGATGLMNGIGTPGGAINLIRKRPTAAFQAVARAEVGSWNFRRLEADVSTPLNAAGNVRGRLVVAAQENDSYIDRLKEERQVVYGVVEADISPATQLHAGASLQQFNATAHARGGLPAYFSDGDRTQWRVSDSAAADWAYSDRRYTSVFLGLEHRFQNDWKLKLALNRNESAYDEVLGYASGGNPDRLTGAGVNLWAGRWAATPRQDSLDVYATGQFDWLGRRHDLTVGALVSRTFFHDNTYANWYHTGWDWSVPNIYTWDGSSPAAPSNPATGTYSSGERVSSAYASARLRATSDLSVLLGARVTDWSRYQTNTPFSTGNPTITDRKESGEVTPYLGLVYDLNTNWSVYGSYTTIFKPQNLKLADGAYIEPLLGHGQEVGTKAEFLDGRLQFAAALFDTSQDNLGVSLPGVFAPDGAQAYESVSGTRTRGVELEVHGEPVPGWQLSAGWAHNRTRDRKGEPLLTQVPRTTAKLFSTYRLKGVGAGLTLGGGVRWQSEIHSRLTVAGQPVRFSQAAYAVVDLMARYAWTPSTSISLNVYNLLDKRYHLTTGNSYQGAPRSVRVALEKRF
jgi:outer membrane receptor for ferric coprogen and ferric-rhodotorulic acid